jgi:hypothetical protein
MKTVMPSPDPFSAEAGIQFCQTAVYVIRTHDGVGGREASPDPESPTSHCMAIRHMYIEFDGLQPIRDRLRSVIR